MSLPSQAGYYNCNDILIYTNFVNVGWFLTEDNWIKCATTLPKIYGTVYINLYGIKVPYSWIHDETKLRELFREDREEYRRKCLRLPRDEYKNKTDSVPIDNKNIRADQLAIMIPRIRKVMPELIAHEILGVQPMTDCTAAFDLKTRYHSKYAIVCNIQKQYHNLKHIFDNWIIFVKSVIRYYI
jgi:hypothetical protein